MSSFVAEVKSDLMGEQTILCGMLQTGAILSFEKMVADGIAPGYASKLIQYGWETITEALKHGGITGMMHVQYSTSRRDHACNGGCVYAARSIMYMQYCYYSTVRSFVGICAT